MNYLKMTNNKEKLPAKIHLNKIDKAEQFYDEVLNDDDFTAKIKIEQATKFSNSELKIKHVFLHPEYCHKLTWLKIVTGDTEKIILATAVEKEIDKRCKKYEKEIKDLIDTSL